MLKTVQRNSVLYRNNNNIWLLYEYTWNNSFSKNDLFKLTDFIQRENIYAEIFVFNYKWVKKYYISFFDGELAYANNYNNYDNKVFHSRYNKMLNSIEKKVKKLEIFDWNRLIPTDLKLYNFKVDEESNEQQRSSLLKKYWYKRKEVKSRLLENNFQLYMSSLLEPYGDNNFKEYIYNQNYISNMNFDFYNSDEEIFDVNLQFMTGNKFFIFPFYLKWKDSTVWNISYQELDFNSIMWDFLDKNVEVDEKTKWKSLIGYQYKVSLSPTNVISDKNNNQVSYAWRTTKFDLNSVDDEKWMFFDFQHSLFLYSKRPDLQQVLIDFDKNFETELELTSSDIPKDFNPQYLSHNKFNGAFHVWHVKNLESILQTLKEYIPEQKDWILLWREYFSNNDFKINFFDMVWKNKEDMSLNANANTSIIAKSGAGKTFFVREKIFKQNKKDQMIMFDNLDNFAWMYNNMEDWELKESINLIEYWSNFPNIIGDINVNNLWLKQDILYKLITGKKSELSASIKTMINANINIYLKSILNKKFKLDNFLEYINNLWDDKIDKNDKATLLNQVYAMNHTMTEILNNEKSFDQELYKKQKVILSYWELLSGADKDEWYFLLEILLILVNGYLARKNRMISSGKDVKFPYTMVLYDEAHNVMDKNKDLDNMFYWFVREIRNKKANIVIITQSYTDLPPKLLWSINFRFFLDPDNFDLFEKENRKKTKNEDWFVFKSKLERTFDNFQLPLEKVKERYISDKNLEDQWLIDSNEVTRFCVMVYMENQSLYLINTNSQKK